MKENEVPRVKRNAAKPTELAALTNDTFFLKQASKSNPKPTETDDIKPAECAHHWMLGSPVDGVVSGVCKLCRASKSFIPEPERFRLSPKQKGGINSL